MDEFNPYLSSGTGRSDMHDAGVGEHEANYFALLPIVSLLSLPDGVDRTSTI